MFVDCDIEDFCWQPYGNVYPEKGRLADVVGECLDEELESWVRCLRVRELVGINGNVSRANSTQKKAWNFCTLPIKDLKLYIPPQHSKPSVIVR